MSTEYDDKEQKRFRIHRLDDTKKDSQANLPADYQKRKDIRQKLRVEVRDRLVELARPEGWKDEREDAQATYDRIEIGSSSDPDSATPEQSRFRLITAELERPDLINDPEDKYQRITIILREAREVITKTAKEAGVYRDISRDINQVQEDFLTDKIPWDQMITRLEEIKRNAGNYGREVTRVGQNWTQVPIVDMDGVTEKFAEVALLKTQLARLEADGQGKSARAVELRNIIEYSQWGTPPNLEPLKEKYLRNKKASSGTSKPAGREVNTGTTVRPPHISATFHFSAYESVGYNPSAGESIIPVLDITRSEDRTEAIFRNFASFIDGTIDNPVASWRAYMMDWRRDLRETAKNYVNFQTSTGRKSEADARKDVAGVERSVQLLHAMMAVESAALAMRASKGAGTVGINLLIPGAEGRPNTDLIPDEQEYLISQNPEAYRLVISNPLVKHYYDMLIADSGLTVTEPTAKKGTEITEIDIEKIEEGRLIGKLRDDQSGGFEGWVAETLKTDKKPPVENYQMRYVAARLACDAFLIDKYTTWEYVVTDYMKHEYGVDERLTPYKDWDGNMLTSTLEPFSLPGRIKKVYPGNPAVGDYVEMTFRNPKKFKGNEMVPPTMLGDIKRLSRYNDLLSALYGDSRGGSLPVFDPKMMNDTIPKMATLCIDVYKGKSAYVLANMLRTKAWSLVFETSDPNFSDKFDIYFGEKDPRSNPLVSVSQTMFGPKGDWRTGLIYSLSSAGGRLGIDFFSDEDAMEALKETQQLLASNSPEPSRGWAAAGLLKEFVQGAAHFFPQPPGKKK